MLFVTVFLKWREGERERKKQESKIPFFLFVLFFRKGLYSA